MALDGENLPLEKVKLTKKDAVDKMPIYPHRVTLKNFTFEIW